MAAQSTFRLVKMRGFNPAPALEEFFYVEGGHTIRADRWRVEMFIDLVKERLSTPSRYGYVDGLVSIIRGDRVKWEAFTPELRADLEQRFIDGIDLRDYMQTDAMPAPSIYIFREADADGNLLFLQAELGDKTLYETLQKALEQLNHQDYELGLEYAEAVEQADRVDTLLNQLRDCVDGLQQAGIGIDRIAELLRERPAEKYVVIDDDGRIFLSSAAEINADSLEIRISPLDKAIYILYLRHPEGINFSYLPDYRGELMEMYRKLMPYRLPEEMRQSIDSVTDPTSNSINEKCARIRRAFVTALGNIDSTPYCITGPRGEKKKIQLDRRLVIWK